MRHLITSLLSLVLLVAIGQPAAAQTIAVGGTSGGGGVSGNGSIRVAGVIGQTAVVRTTGPAAWISPGFWYTIFWPPVEDVTASSRLERTDARVDPQTGQLVLHITWTNIGTVPLREPLKLVVDATTPAASVANADGSLSTDGKPYLDFSDLTEDGELAPGETSAVREIVFTIPTDEPVDPAQFQVSMRTLALPQRSAASGTLAVHTYLSLIRVSEAPPVNVVESTAEEIDTP